MGSVGPERCPYCGGDGRADSTLVGWQLEYPFLFAERAVNRTAAAMDKAQVYLESGPYSALNWTYAQRAQDWQWQGVLRQDPEIDPEALQDALEKSVEVMHSFLQGVYQARLDMASEIVIPLNLSFGDFTFYREVTIPVPVELHRVFRPARIVAWSVDGLAAVLSHEVSGLSLGGEKVSYRSVYFSFAPELGGEVCERLMRNAVIWCSEALDPDEVDAGVRIGNTTIYPSSSVLTDPASAVETRNFVVSTDRNATYPVPAGAGEIEIYWDPGSGLGVCPPDGWWIDSSIPGRIVVLGPPGGNGYLTLYSAQTAGLHQDVAVLAVIERHLSIIVALVVGASLAHLASPKAIQGRGCTGGLSAARCLVD